MAVLRSTGLDNHKYRLASPLFIMLVIGLLTFAFYLFQLKKKKKKDGAAALPPGSMGWPLLGETLCLLQANRMGKPESFVRDRMEKHKMSVFKTSLFGKPTAVLCGSTGNKFVSSNENKLVVTSWPSYVNHIFGSPSLLTAVGDESKRIRKFLMTFLKPEALQKFVGTVDTVTRNHLQTEWHGRDKVKVFPLVKKYTFSLACRLFASIDDPPTLTRIFDELNVLVKGIMQIPLNFPGTRHYRARKSGAAIRRELQLIIDRRKVSLDQKTASADQDLMSFLLSKPDKNGQYMTDKEITNNILVLLFGGHDTSSSTLTLILKYLAEIPDCYDRILREQREIAQSKRAGELLNWEDLQKMKYSWNVVSEVLRLAPPVPGNFREAMSDFNFAGFTIPKGWKVYWAAASTHANPEYFVEPEKFDPGRFEGEGPGPYSFVPFGGGPRMCPGKELARVEILVFLHNVVNMFRWEMVFPGETVIADPMPVPVKRLPIRLRPHQS